MPHYRCPTCKTRLYSAASPADLVGDSYPECGSLIEPVREHRRIADCIDDFVARREASLARERLDLERWVDQQVDDRLDRIVARREAISAARAGASSGGG